MSNSTNTATVQEVNSVSEEAGTEMVLKALDFLANPPEGFVNNAEDLQQICSALCEKNFTHYAEVFKTLGRMAQTVDTNEAWMSVRRILIKITGSMSRDVHFKVRALEKQQRRLMEGGEDISLGEVETYNLMAWEDEKFTVADYYSAAHDVKAQIDLWGEVIINIMGWDAEDVERWSIPWMYAVIDTPENLAKPAEKREYRPVHSFSEALAQYDYREELKEAERRKNAKSMVDALLA